MTEHMMCPECGRPTVAAEVSERLASLSERERQICDLMIDGKATKEIAAILDISPKTVDSHRARLCEKMRASNAVELRKLLHP